MLKQSELKISRDSNASTKHYKSQMHLAMAIFTFLRVGSYEKKRDVGKSLLRIQ